MGVGVNEITVGTSTGLLVAYDLSGKLLWKTRLSSQILSAPTIHEGLVIVRTSDNLIHAVNVKDGLKKWTFSRVGPPLSLDQVQGWWQVKVSFMPDFQAVN